MGERLAVSLLGPVSVHDEHGALALRSRPQRIVLACLALDANRVVSAGRLIDALWPDAPPHNAAGNLHSYVSKLRRLVGSDRIRHEHGGYRLDIDAEGVDAQRVDRMLRTAERLPAREGATLLGAALALWRGEPLADLDDVPVLAPDRARLAALRAELERRCAAASIDAGDHARALPALRAAAERDPHDEAVVVLLARALDGSGRTAEALRTVSGFRRRIAEDTGLVAGPELVRVEQRLLQGAPPMPATAERPRFTTDLHGREDELDRLDRLLDRQRVVTLTGTAGIGKTRLAAAIAEQRSARGQTVHFLALAPLGPDDDLAARLAAALGLRVGTGHDPAGAIHERLGGGGQLLVLDNCEHVLEPVRRLVDDLTSRRSDLTILTTSRTALGLVAECVVRVPALTADGRAGRELFLERARRVRPGFDPTVEDAAALRTVIEALGGLPLAIELAAARMGSMTVAELAARIDDLDLLADGRSVGRHRTLRAAIDWSYQLLGAPIRRLLRAVSAFPGGVELATVEELAADLDLPGRGAAEIVALADASLVDVSMTGTARYTMSEPVRAFANERLAAEGERPAVEAWRTAWARRTAAWIETAGRSPDEAAADACLRAELVNLRAAHRAARQDGELGDAIAISTALVRPATARDLPEVWAWALELAAHPDLRAHARCADALGAAATAAWLTGDLEGGERLATEALERDADSVPALQALGSIRLFQGEPETAHRLWIAASRPHGGYLPQAALAAVYTGDPTLARQSLAEADAWASGVGSPTEVALCRYAWGELLAPGPAAVSAYEEAIALATSVGASFVAGIGRVGLASALAADGRDRRAVDELAAVIRYWRGTGNWIQQLITLRNAATLLDRHGRADLAAQVRAVAAADRARQSPGEASDVVVASVLAALAEIRRAHATSDTA